MFGGEKRIKRIVKESNKRKHMKEREKDWKNEEEIEWKEKNIKFVHNFILYYLIKYLYSFFIMFSHTFMELVLLLLFYINFIYYL